MRFSRRAFWVGRWGCVRSVWWAAGLFAPLMSDYVTIFAFDGVGGDVVRRVCVCSGGCSDSKLNSG